MILHGKLIPRSSWRLTTDNIKDDVSQQKIKLKKKEEEHSCSLFILALNVIKTLPQSKARRNMSEFTQEKTRILVNYITKLFDLALT